MRCVPGISTGPPDPTSQSAVFIPSQPETTNQSTTLRLGVSLRNDSL